MIGKQEGGSLKGCLLNYFKQRKVTVLALKVIKPKLIKLSTNKGEVVAKQFTSLHRLLMQGEFLKRLRDGGFEGAYTFSEEFEPFTCNGRHIGFLEYIPSHSETFNYHTYRNRLEGLSLLKGMHKTSAKIHKEMNRTPASFSQIEKWRERLNEFSINARQFKKVIPDNILYQYIRMGEWSLEKLRGHELEEGTEPIIIHGDVAHHNFLRRIDGKLILIDFDLMAKAPPIIDDLQYANRLLAFNHFSLKEILSFRYLKKYRDNPLFLAGLAFPTDIYREWNRVYRENLWNSTMRLQSLWNLTVDDFQLRRQFIQDIQKLIE